MDEDEKDTYEHAREIYRESWLMLQEFRARGTPGLEYWFEELTDAMLDLKQA
jgi:hypothetical protein